MNSIIAASTTNRAAITNNPLRARADGRSPQGRRIRDLYRSYLAVVANRNDPVTQAGVLAAAELMVVAETARARLLSDSSSWSDIDQVVKIENLAARTLRRLGIRTAPGRDARR